MINENQLKNIKRWRLILGEDSNQKLQDYTDNNIIPLSQDEYLMDQALSTIYNEQPNTSLSKGAGHGISSPVLAKWLGDIRSLFDKDIVKIIQTDAIERKGLKQLLLEPEVLQEIEPDINTAATILALKDHIPQASKDSVRIYIRKIVEEIEKLLANDIRRAVTAALNKNAHSPIPSSSAIDYKLTIKRNLKNYNSQLKKIIPEHVYFFDHACSSNNWNVIVDIDQSGSMGESIIYSSIMSCILASMTSIKTRIVAFDTQVIDLTDKTSDPVDLLFGIQMGGGTDINKSIAYCEQFIENPSKTLFFLISDLEEGGNCASLIRRLSEMKESGVTVVSLLAISDSGKPYYSQYVAKHIAELDIPCFACSPNVLPELIKNALSKKSFENIQTQTIL